MFSCSGSDKEGGQTSAPYSPKKEKGFKQGSYSFSPSKAQVIWYGFKTTEKTKVQGEFAEFSSSRANQPYDSLEDLLDGLDFSINTKSSESRDAIRDLNLRDYFFNKLTENFKLRGVLGVPDNDSIPVTFYTLLGAKTILFSYSFIDNYIKIQGSLDIIDDLGAPSAFNSIHQKCEVLHTGGDGVSKTWSEVEIFVGVPIMVK